MIDGFGAGFAGGDGKGEGPDGVAAEGSAEADKKEEDAARNGEAEEFADGEGDHDVALQRTDAAARLLHAEQAAGDGDEVAALLGGVTHPMECFNAEPGVMRHEPTHDGVFLRTRPRHGDEEEKNGEGEVLEPRRAAEEIKQAECHSHSGDGSKGRDHAPISVGKNHGLQRGEEEGGGEKENDGDGSASGGRRGGSGAVGPAAGEEEDGENGDECPVAVLRIERPLPPVGAKGKEPAEDERGNPPPKGGGGGVRQGRGSGHRTSLLEKAERQKGNVLLLSIHAT